MPKENWILRAATRFLTLAIYLYLFINEERLCAYAEEVSMMVMGTRSGKKSAGRRVGGITRGTLSGKDSVAAAAIKLDFPVKRSPATTTLTPEAEFPPGIEALREREREIEN